MDGETLLLEGAEDIASNISGFVSEAYGGEKYFDPNDLINNTKGHNELDFSRIQKGEKKQPDYILTFRKNKEIKNIEDALKAQKQWEDKLPIVVVDIDKCIEQEKQKIYGDEENQGLKYEYEKNPTKENAKKLYYAVRNNTITCNRWNLEKEFEDIDLAELKEKFEEKEIGINTLKEAYEQTTAKERENEMSRIQRIYNQIKDITKEK